MKGLKARSLPFRRKIVLLLIAFIIFGYFVCITIFYVTKQMIAGTGGVPRDPRIAERPPQPPDYVLELEHLANAPLIPDRIEEQANELKRVLNKAQGSQLKGDYYAHFALRVASTLLLADRPDFVSKLLKDALEKTPAEGKLIASRLSLFNQMGVLLRMKYYKTSGAEWRMHRLEAASLLFQGLVEGQKYRIKSKLKYDLYEPQLKRRDELSALVNQYLERRKPAEAERPKDSQLLDEYRKMENLFLKNKNLQEAAQNRFFMERLDGTIGIIMSNVVDIYATEPYDFSELEALCRQYLGDSDLAREVLNKTRHECDARINARRKKEQVRAKPTALVNDPDKNRP